MSQRKLDDLAAEALEFYESDCQGQFFSLLIAFSSSP
jgi:hypothetical protein